MLITTVLTWSRGQLETWIISIDNYKQSVRGFAPMGLNNTQSPVC